MTSYYDIFNHATHTVDAPQISPLQLLYRHKFVDGCYLIGDPNGTIPGARTVLGNSPEPQRINDPKSLYQSPLGAIGPVFTQSCNRRRSSVEIWRSATRAKRCSQTGRGRLANRIFGDRVLSEDRPDQIFTCLVLPVGISFGHETVIRRIELFPCCCLCFQTTFCQYDKRPVHREMLFFRHAPDSSRQLSWNCDALTYRRTLFMSGLGTGFHVLRIR